MENIIRIELPEISTFPKHNITESTPITGGIYFLFDDEKVIYIGMSNNISKRFYQHSHQSPWFEYVKYYSIYSITEGIELIEGIYIYKYLLFFNRHINIHIETGIKKYLPKKEEPEQDWETVHKSYREHHPAFVEEW